jgi:hypothetical protein
MIGAFHLTKSSQELETKMLKWPERSRRSIAAFFTRWNDIDVFVEDTAKFAKNLYIALVNRALAGKSEVTTVIPLGDREKVLQACSLDSNPSNRHRIYLIDGDLDLAAGIPAPNIKRLFRHNLYHLENYFICEDALLTVLHEENPRYEIEALRAILNFEGWLTSIEPLVNLFEVFGLTKLIDPSLPTISLGVGSFTTNSKLEALDTGKIATFCSQRITELEARTSAAVVTTAKLQVTTAMSNFQNPIDIVSAREFLFPLLRSWISTQGLRVPATESFFFRLAKNCSIDRHEDFVNAVSEAAA